jgi:lipoprotein-anchoring transpeptidase ErfK/SrfK
VSGGAIVLAGVLAAAVTAAVAAQAPVSSPPAAPVYRFEPLPKTLAELSQRFTPAQIELLEMINRRDREHLVRTEPVVPGLVVPDVWHDDPLAYSPFPPVWPSAEAHAKAIVVHQAMQAFAAYEYGRLVRWGPVSTGRKETPTPDGAFYLTWRARSRRSTDNEDWLLEWYFNFVNARGVSFHLFDLPGYPASHACVRLLLRDAQWLYGWGDQWKLDATGRVVTERGTPVVIHGRYGFGDPAPWLSLDALSVPLGMPAMVVPPGQVVADVAVGGGSLRRDSGR